MYINDSWRVAFYDKCFFRQNCKTGLFLFSLYTVPIHCTNSPCLLFVPSHRTFTPYQFTFPFHRICSPYLLVFNSPYFLVLPAHRTFSSCQPTVPSHHTFSSYQLVVHFMVICSIKIFNWLYFLTLTSFGCNCEAVTFRVVFANLSWRLFLFVSMRHLEMLPTYISF